MKKHNLVAISCEIMAVILFFVPKIKVEPFVHI